MVQAAAAGHRVVLVCATNGAVGEPAEGSVPDGSTLAAVRLAELDERKAKVVELRYFSGLSMDEVARALGVSKRSAESDWTFARAWLRKELAD